MSRMEVESPAFKYEVDMGKWVDLSDHPLLLEMAYISTQGGQLCNCNTGSPAPRWLALLGGSVEVRTTFREPESMSEVLRAESSQSILKASSSRLKDLQQKRKIFTAAYGANRSFKRGVGHLFENTPLNIPGKPIPSMRDPLNSLIKQLFDSVETFELWGQIHDWTPIVSYLQKSEDPATKIDLRWLSPSEDHLLAWVLDLMFQYAKYTDRTPNPRTMCGIIAIEMFDLYTKSLKESVELRTLLQHVFPNIQFFVTARFPVPNAAVRKSKDVPRRSQLRKALQK